jgi:peptidoglycan/LPS O-acetylase OafA/YrhL
MGILRFLLALSVLAAHASGIGIPLPNGKPYPSWVMSLIGGPQAVTFFFIISGFYMAMILNTKYRDNTLRFYGNRFLRLWPTYIVVFILACIFTPAGSFVLKATQDCGVFVKGYIWLSNIFILGTDSFWLFNLEHCKLYFHLNTISGDTNGGYLLINQPVFTISIEIIFYLMAPFILRSIKRTWIYFAIGVLYCFCFVLMGKINTIYQYYLFPSSFIYFALGALAWHYSKTKDLVLTDKRIVWIFIICLCLMFVYTLFSMIILLCFTFAIPKLFELTKNSKADRLIGELSYPLYIVHHPVLLFLGGLPISNETRGIICLSLTLLISMVIHFSLERPIDKWRQKIAMRG